MKKMILTVMILCLAVNFAYAGNYKKYPDKSGKIVYELTGNTKGNRTLYWDDYGYKEMTVEKSVTKIFGMTQETNTYTLILGKDVYTWSDQDEKLNKTHNPIIDAWEENGYDDKDMETFAYQVMEQMGYEKTGSETINGKSCEIWEGSMGKLWIWSLYNYKTEVKLMGMKMTSLATDVDINSSVPASIFEYPKDREITEVEFE